MPYVYLMTNSIFYNKYFYSKSIPILKCLNESKSADDKKQSTQQGYKCFFNRVKKCLSLCYSNVSANCYSTERNIAVNVQWLAEDGIICSATWTKDYLRNVRWIMQNVFYSPVNARNFETNKFLNNLDLFAPVTEKMILCILVFFFFSLFFFVFY